jgi:hypothetical protein
MLKEVLMSLTSKPATRRKLLIGAAALTGLPILGAATEAAAAGISKADAKYQTTPKGAQQCSKCLYFVAGATPKAAAKCKLVAGAIVPQGWCQLYAQKSGG